MEISLQKHYQKIHEEGLKLIKNEDYFIDPQINDPEDSRRGITLLARPEEVAENINRFLLQLKKIEPQQYYYPPQDFHVTIMSIISCYTGFKLDQISTKEYISVIQKSLSEIDKFSIKFKGISLNPSGILVNGYPCQNTLNHLRDILRNNFRVTDLEQSLDKRYAIKTAHSTILRFQNSLKQPDKLIEFVEKHQQEDFGTFEVQSIELVFNDWYQKAENTILLKNFDL